MLLMKAVMDTAVQGFDVDPSLLLICNHDERKGSITEANSRVQTDGDGGIPNAHDSSLYQLISDSNVEVGLLWM